jgi:predicted NUDIX family NTP pyrophosphohydrolase
MQKTSAGIQMYRLTEEGCQVLLGHPGGPLYSTKDDGYWSIPKGQVEAGETVFEAANREFCEETGLALVARQPIILGSAPGYGRTIHIWAVKGDCDTSVPPRSNLFKMEWPEGSGTLKEYPEFDRIEFFGIDYARRKIEPVQAVFLERLAANLLSADIRYISA